VKKKKTVTYRGPLCANKCFVASLYREKKPKNSSAAIEDKPWKLLTVRPKIKTREKYEKSSGKHLTGEITAEWLTVKFEHKESPETTMTIVFDQPADWNDQKEVSALIEDMAQTVRREAGTNVKNRTDYDHEELNWILEYFEPENRKGYKGGKFFDNMSQEMNAKFEGTKAVLKNGEVSTEFRQHRKANGLLSKCTRDKAIRAVRGDVTRPKSTTKQSKKGVLMDITKQKGNVMAPGTTVAGTKKGGESSSRGSDDAGDSDKENIPPR
jgi:hypothetical protein